MVSLDLFFYLWFRYQNRIPMKKIKSIKNHDMRRLIEKKISALKLAKNEAII